jgi:predicted nucleotidyltransferase
MDLSNSISTVIPSVEGRVLQVLARTDMPLSGTRVASFIPTATREGVRRALHRLVDSGLVIAESAPPSILYTGNADHLLWPAVAQLMRDADQIVHLLKRRAVSFTETLFPDATERERLTLALFGSVARGDSGPDSDIDVLLIAPDDIDTDRVDGLIATLIDGLGAATGNDANVHAVTRSRFDELAAQDDPMIASWTADATVFHGPDFRRRLRGARWDER